MKDMIVRTQTHDYPIIIDSGIDFTHDVFKGRQLFLISDENVGGLYGDDVQTGLEKAGGKVTHRFYVAGGEQSKSFETYHVLAEELLHHGIDRNSLIIALGGGVVGDLAGFLAATVLRGVDVVQIPTTLLAQVDSSVGGKTGINTQKGKNLIGAFYPPRAVFMGLDMLSTLESRQMKAGYAEVVKYGLINDPDFFDWLRENGASLLQQKTDILSHAVLKSCQAKADIVQADEKEKGMRALLNLGHSFGHAIEALAGYNGRVLHGEAVAMGIVMAAALSVQQKLMTEGELDRIKNHFENLDIQTQPNAHDATLLWSVDDFLAAMMHDKKVINGRLHLILMKGIGKAFQTDMIDQTTLRAFLCEQDFLTDK